MTNLTSSSIERVAPNAVRSNPPRVLILGGSAFQIPMIRHARSEGAYVITCDYLPNNPGHVLADEYHNVSTTDRDAVFKLASDLSIDAILSFASEPALQTIAYVANRLGLPGPPLDAVIKLTEKDAFRRMLREAKLPVPNVVTLTGPDSPQNAPSAMREYGIDFPCIIKPVDSSGSKGITVLTGPENLSAAVGRALTHSRSGRCIIEEYIDGVQIHGDGYLHDGELVFHYLGDHYFYTDSGSRIPTSTRWPSHHSETIIRSIADQVEEVALRSGYHTGPVNIEARVPSGQDPYLIEVSPRNGGNHVPIIINALTGFNFLSEVYRQAFSSSSTIILPSAPKKPGAYYVLHSEIPGILVDVSIDPRIRDNLILLDTFIEPGHPVGAFTGSNTSIGVALFAFSENRERDLLMDQVQDLVVVRIQGV